MVVNELQLNNIINIMFHDAMRPGIVRNVYDKNVEVKLWDDSLGIFLEETVLVDKKDIKPVPLSIQLVESLGLVPVAFGTPLSDLNGYALIRDNNTKLVLLKNNEWYYSPQGDKKQIHLVNKPVYLHNLQNAIAFYDGMIGITDEELAGLMKIIKNEQAYEK